MVQLICSAIRDEAVHSRSCRSRAHAEPDKATSSNQIKRLQSNRLEKIRAPPTFCLGLLRNKWYRFGVHMDAAMTYYVGKGYTSMPDAARHLYGRFEYFVWLVRSEQCRLVGSGCMVDQTELYHVDDH